MGIEGVAGGTEGSGVFGEETPITRLCPLTTYALVRLCSGGLLMGYWGVFCRTPMILIVWRRCLNEEKEKETM